MKDLRPSVIVLIVANLVPLYGVIALDWPVFPILFLFWMENVFVGLFTALKILIANPSSLWQWLSKLLFLPFFCIHYGMFTVVHGVFVIGIFGGQSMKGGGMPGSSEILTIIQNYQLLYPALALFASHAFSFVYYYLGKGEFRAAAIQTLMTAPYGRIVVLHITILGGGFLLMALKSPMAGLLVLVALKTVIDTIAHIKSHRGIN